MPIRSLGIKKDHILKEFVQAFTVNTEQYKLIDFPCATV